MSTNKPNIKTRVEEIGPEQAAKMLELVPTNRKVSQRTVDRYASDMKHGKWRVTGEPIILDEDGNLLDGQHRLWAVIQSGATVMMVVVHGVGHEAIWSIDQGRPRSVAQVMGMHGWQNTHRLCAVARTVDILEYGDSSRSLSVDDIRGIIRRHKGIEWIMSQPNVGGSGPLCTSGPLAAFALFYERYGEDAATTVWRRFSEGVDLQEGDAIHTVRRHLETSNVKEKGASVAIDRAKRVMSALMHYVEGRSMKKSILGSEGLKHFFPRSKAA